MTKKGLLTKAERTALEKLLADESFKGKKDLRFLIWMNTTNPKFKKGECFKVTDRSRRFYGVPAVGINARITEIEVFRGYQEYRYTLEAHIVNKDGRDTTVFLFADESDLTVKVKGNENKIDGNGKYEDMMDVYIAI